jgi:methyl-accepting chemotaxis protein
MVVINPFSIPNASCNTLTIGAKQFLGFGHVLMIMAGVNTYTLYQMEAVKAEVDAVTNNWLPKVAAISALNLGTANLRTGQLQYAAADTAVQKQQVATLIDLIDQINTHRDKYEAFNLSTAEKVLYEDQFDPEWERYQDLSFLFFQYVDAGMEQEAVVLLNNQGRKIFEGFSADLQELVGISQVEAEWASANAAVTYDRTRRVISFLLGVTVFFSVGLSVVLVRHITVPVQQLKKAARRVAAGDLEVRLESSGRDEIGGLTGSFNQMTAALHAAREETRRQAGALSETNHELANKSLTLEEKNSDLENALQALRETQEQLLLQEKMASLGRLVAGVAHEINNPVASVISNADVTRRCVERMEAMAQAGGLLAAVQDDRRWG